MYEQLTDDIGFVILSVVVLFVWSGICVLIGRHYQAEKDRRFREQEAIGKWHEEHDVPDFLKIVQGD